MDKQMCDTDCKFNGNCKADCNKIVNCKLYVMRTNDGVVEVKRLSNNARIPVKRTPEAAGYDLAAAQSELCPAHGKVIDSPTDFLRDQDSCNTRRGIVWKKVTKVIKDLVQSESNLPQNQLSQRPRMNQDQNQCPSLL